MNHVETVEARCAATEKMGGCQSCGKRGETKVVAFYYWRMEVCKKCENVMRDNGHIR